MKDTGCLKRVEIYPDRTTPEGKISLFCRKMGGIFRDSACGGTWGIRQDFVAVNIEWRLTWTNIL